MRYFGDFIGGHHLVPLTRGLRASKTLAIDAQESHTCIVSGITPVI